MTIVDFLTSTVGQAVITLALALLVIWVFQRLYSTGKSATAPAAKSNKAAAPAPAASKKKDAPKKDAPKKDTPKEEVKKDAPKKEQNKDSKKQSRGPTSPVNATNKFSGKDQTKWAPAAEAVVPQVSTGKPTDHRAKGQQAQKKKGAGGAQVASPGGKPDSKKPAVPAEKGFEVVGAPKKKSKNNKDKAAEEALLSPLMEQSSRKGKGQKPKQAESALPAMDPALQPSAAAPAPAASPSVMDLIFQSDNRGSGERRGGGGGGRGGRGGGRSAGSPTTSSMNQAPMRASPAASRPIHIPEGTAGTRGWGAVGVSSPQ